MSNKRRAHLLFLGGLIYSVFSVISMVVVVINGSGIALGLSITSFMLMTLSLIFSINFSSTDYEQLRPWVFRASFILLIPLWVVSTVLTFILDVCIKIFPALEKDEGGDDDYDD